MVAKLGRCPNSPLDKALGHMPLDAKLPPWAEKFKWKISEGWLSHDCSNPLWDLSCVLRNLCPGDLRNQQQKTRSIRPDWISAVHTLEARHLHYLTANLSASRKIKNKPSAAKRALAKSAHFACHNPIKICTFWKFVQFVRHNTIKVHIFWKFAHFACHKAIKVHIFCMSPRD